MNLVKNLQRQHKDLAEISHDIENSMQGNVSFADRDFRKDLSLMEGKLKIHLSMEDKYLYPLLLEHENQKVRELAGEYKKEMLDLFDIFHAFILKLKEADHGNPDDTQMRIDLRRILGKLAVRIDYEEETLIPLLKEIGFQ